MEGKTDASLTVSGGKISGYVENHLPVKLENAAVYLYGQVVILGDLEPDRGIELENEKLLVWAVGMTWLLADRVCGYPDRADDSERRIHGKYSEIRSRRIFCGSLLFQI